MNIKVGTKVIGTQYDDSVQKEYMNRIGKLHRSDSRNHIIIYDDGRKVYYPKGWVRLANPKKSNIRLVSANNKELVVSFKTNKIKKKAQQDAFGKLIKQGRLDLAQKYISSFEGNRYNQAIPRVKTKGEDPYQYAQIPDLKYSMYSTSDGHKPVYNGPGWTGVEIECFIPYKSLDVEAVS